MVMVAPSVGTKLVAIGSSVYWTVDGCCALVVNLCSRVQARLNLVCLSIEQTRAWARLDDGTRPLENRDDVIDFNDRRRFVNLHARLPYRPRDRIGLQGSNGSPDDRLDHRRRHGHCGRRRVAGCGRAELATERGARVVREDGGGGGCQQEGEGEPDERCRNHLDATGSAGLGK